MLKTAFVIKGVFRVRKMLKIGVVGGGHIVNHRHIPVFKKIKDVEVSAICDKEEAFARKTAEQFGVKKYFTSLAEMLKEQIDIVDICTPPQTHFSLAVEAMEAGCHVLVEKPLAMTVKEVDEMVRVSRRKHVKLCVIHQNLFNPAVQGAQKLVKGGALGDVISVDVGTFIRRDNYMCLNSKHWCHTLPGGIFFEILPHPIYLFQMFAKEGTASCVIGKKLSDHQWMKFDELRVLLKARKAIGSVVASCNSPFHGDTLNLLGTKLGLQVDLWGRSIIKFKPRTEDPYSVGKNNLDLASQFLSLVGTTARNSLKAAIGGVEVSAHYGFISEFVQCIREDKETPVSLEDARENVRIVAEICNLVDDLSQE
jgi:predicted dehydrogenase